MHSYFRLSWSILEIDLSLPTCPRRHSAGIVISLKIIAAFRFLKFVWETECIKISFIHTLRQKKQCRYQISEIYTQFWINSWVLLLYKIFIILKFQAFLKILHNYFSYTIEIRQCHELARQFQSNKAIIFTIMRNKNVATDNEK